MSPCREVSVEYSNQTFRPHTATRPHHKSDRDIIKSHAVIALFQDLSDPTIRAIGIRLTE